MLENFTAIAMNFLCLLLGIGGTQSFPPPLPAAEERCLFAKMKEGDRAARTKLIEHNLRLVAHIVRKYYTSYHAPDDLISIGSLGLIKAIDTFNCENGARFATYAAKCIQNEILMFFRSQKKLACEVSINETIDIDRDGNPLTYIDIISCEDTIADDLDIKLHTQYAYRLIKDTLSEREQQILILRYGLTGKQPKAQREVAKMLGISRSYVSRIEKRALAKIKENFEARNFYPDGYRKK
ncbi:MAG: RNA polymerase sporulation sigma factor SigK [Clostridia bacterium]|nr:RNA polymerase sporulation sigma factor SigK [Clostridia bacterium]